MPAADGLGGYAVLAGLAAVGASLAPVIGPILEVSVPPQRQQIQEVQPQLPHTASLPLSDELDCSSGCCFWRAAASTSMKQLPVVCECAASGSRTLYPETWQVRALSKLPADGIEAAAAVPEPLQNADGSGAVKLWGEDALLDWPGAMGPGELLPASSRSKHAAVP